MPKEPNGKKSVAAEKKVEFIPDKKTETTSKKVYAEPKKESSLYYTGLDGRVGLNRPSTPAEWKEEAIKKGWEMVPSNAIYPSYKIPGKNYEIVKDGKKIRLPYEGYTFPTKNSPLIDPTRKPMDFNSGMGMYDPNSGLYMDESGKLIEPIIESYAKGGKVKGYAVGGSPGFLETNPEMNKITNNGKNTPSQVLSGQTGTGAKTKSKNFSIDNQNIVAAGLNLGTSALTSYNAKQKGEMNYGSNAYFDKMAKQDKAGDAIYGVVGAAASAYNPLLGAAVNAIPTLGNAISGADAYGVSDKSDARIAAGMLLNQKDQIRSIGRGAKEIGKGNIGRGLAYMTPLGGLIMNDERKYEREKLKYENEQGQNQLEYDQAVEDRQAQGKYNVQNALAMRNEGIANYKSNDFVKDPTLKQAEFKAPEKSKTLTAFGLAKGGGVPGDPKGFNSYKPKPLKSETTNTFASNKRMPTKDELEASKMFNDASKNQIKYPSKDTVFEDVVEIIDPTGISSWDDVYRAYQKSGMSQDTFIEALGAIPLLGKVGKLSKSYNYLAKTPRQAASINRFNNAVQLGALSGKGSDAYQAVTNQMDYGLAKGGSVKGGTIKGAGTGTSDSIDAQVKENSFVVPAKNNKVAKTLREVMLGDEPDAKAKVKQGVGPKVKLSNGEHLFTPAERAKLEANGVNLYDLAPDAEDNDEFSKGGDTKMKKQGFAAGGGVDDSYLRSEKAKIAAERAENTKRLGATRADQIANQKTERLNVAIKDLLAQQANDRKKAEVEYNAALRDYEKVKKSYEYTRKPNKTIQDREQAMLSGYQQSTISNLSPDQKLAESETALKRLETQKARLEKAKKDYEFSTNESNYVNTKNLTPYIAGTKMQSTPRQTASSANDPFGILAAGRGETIQGVTMGADPYGVAKNKPATSAKPSDAATSPLIAPAPATSKKATIATAGAKKTLGTDYNPMMSDTFDPNAFAFDNQGELPEAAPTSPTSLADAALSLNPDVKAMQPIIPDDPTLTKDVQDVTNSGKANPTGSKFGWQDGLGAAINYGIPLAQSIIGFNQLQKIGDRPIDKLDADLVSAFDTTRDNAAQANLAARYGMSPEEMASLRMQNAALTNTGRYAARNFSGGSSANALNMERSVINDSFNRALQAKVADKNLQMQKQQNAYGMQNAVNSLAQYKQEANRRLFQDDLTAFQQKTDAAATLMGTGLSNLSDMSAADRRMREFKKLNSK